MQLGIPFHKIKSDVTRYENKIKCFKEAAKSNAQYKHGTNIILFQEYLVGIEHLRKDFDRRNQFSPLVEEPQKGSSIMTTIEDFKERLQILIGEISSGNANEEFKNMLPKNFTSTTFKGNG